MWKLRAWDERKKIMHNDFQFIRSGETGADWIVFISDKHTLDRKIKDPALPHIFDDPFFWQQLKIMRGVGLEDKNGKPIFECDLLRDKYGNTFSVVYDDAQWWAVTKEMVKTGIDSSSVHRNEYEVVGNVFETPIPATV
jgi:hypothetical protein